MIARNALESVSEQTVADEAQAVLHDLIEAFQGRDTTAIMECFGAHPVLMLAHIGTPVEGRGAVRRFFERGQRAGLPQGRPSIESVSVRGHDRALVRALSRNADGMEVRLVAALNKHGERWLITHCHWTAAQRS